MKYTSYMYLYPPRPENIVPRGGMGFYQRQGYWAQVKKNGTNTVIFARGVEVIFKTRHNDDHKQWSPTPEIIKFFQSDSTEWNVFCAELLHSKVRDLRHQLYIYDQIVDSGVHLVGTTFEERQLNLHARWVGVDERDQLRVHANVSVAKNFVGSFGKLWEELGPEDEGLVLKQASGKLRACLKPDANAGWQVKSRVPHKNYSF